MSKRIVIAGGTGFIGVPLVEKLLSEGFEVIVLSRTTQTSTHPRLQYARWDSKEMGKWTSYLDGAYAVVNLAGESINAKKWTPVFKDSLLKSRIFSTRTLVAAMEYVTTKPMLFVSASAIGYYGYMPPSEATESTKSGKDFLAELCVQWETESHRAKQLGVRVINPRIAVVLGRDGGILKSLSPVFKAFLGGPVGSGKQAFPWVDIQDVVGAILFLITKPGLEGPFNIVSPDRRSMTSFCQMIGKILKRPSWLKVPQLMLGILRGKEFSNTVCHGRPVSPAKLIAAGYHFKVPSLNTSLSTHLK